jgi:hypothetical protein
VAPTDSVNVDVTEPPGDGVTEAGVKVRVTPVGAPEATRLTAELKPLIEVTFIVDVSELPCTIVNEDGDAEMEKSGAGETVSVILAVCVRTPPIPLTVNS